MGIRTDALPNMSAGVSILVSKRSWKPRHVVRTSARKSRSHLTSKLAGRRHSDRGVLVSATGVLPQFFSVPSLFVPPNVQLSNVRDSLVRVLRARAKVAGERGEVSLSRLPAASCRAMNTPRNACVSSPWR